MPGRPHLSSASFERLPLPLQKEAAIDYLKSRIQSIDNDIAEKHFLYENLSPETEDRVESLNDRMTLMILDQEQKDRFKETIEDLKDTAPYMVKKVVAEAVRRENDVKGMLENDLNNNRSFDEIRKKLSAENCVTIQAWKDARSGRK